MGTPTRHADIHDIDDIDIWTCRMGTEDRGQDGNRGQDRTGTEDRKTGWGQRTERFQNTFHPPELHDELLIAREEVPPAPGKVERVGREGHAVVQVVLGGDVLQGQALDVAVRVAVGKDVDALMQSWALEIFFYFFNSKKMTCCFFYQVNLTGSGLFKQD